MARADAGASRHPERHHTGRSGWLRAGVLGANDGLISTSSLLVGVAAAQAAREPLLITGLAGLLSGALSMAAGEYVSVSSQADTERADLEQEARELATQPGAERAELAAIYVRRGLAPELAAQVAEQLSAHDALAAHARDELGISRATRARPIQAALASAVAFSLGAAAPVLIVLLLPVGFLVPAISASTLVLLAVLGAVAARLGGAPRLKGSLRVAFWGAAAMIVTGMVGRLFDSSGG
ncbi:MAG TPA: VIT family protein [Methylomirabilota bacterium]|nr:VIT family protein [Methylomirabilota bacterium]